MHLIYIILMSNILLSIGWIEKQEQIHLWRDVSNYLHSYTNTAWLNVHPVMILFLDFYMNFSLRSSTKVQIVKIFTLLIFSAWWKNCSLKRNYNLYLLMIILRVIYCFFAWRPTVIWLQSNNFLADFPIVFDYLTYPHNWLKEQEENKKDRTAKKDKTDLTS